MKTWHRKDVCAPTFTVVLVSRYGNSISAINGRMNNEDVTHALMRVRARAHTHKHTEILFSYEKERNRAIWARVGRRRQWHPTLVLLPGKSHGRRSLVGCSPWGCEESDTTERLHFDFSLSCIGDGNGNPLQCSCLENPRDGGAWWAAVYEVAQSDRTEVI